MFIVLDGIDGAGKGRQRIEVMHVLRKKFKLQVKGEEFPVHNAFYETVIHPALQEETTMNEASWVLAYLLDKTLEAETIKPFVGNKDSFFVADGYFSTTIAYQALLMEQVSVEKLLSYSEDFEIPKPDLSIYIDVDPEIAFDRKEKEEGHEEGLDIFEKSITKQKRLRGIFKQMVQEDIYGPWESVDGNGTIEEVTDKIISILKEKSIIKIK